MQKMTRDNLPPNSRRKIATGISQRETTGSIFFSCHCLQNSFVAGMTISGKKRRCNNLSGDFERLCNAVQDFLRSVSYIWTTVTRQFHPLYINNLRAYNGISSRNSTDNERILLPTNQPSRCVSIFRLSLQNS